MPRKPHLNTVVLPGKGQCGACDRPAQIDGWCRPHYEMFGDVAWQQVGEKKLKPKVSK
jgi:hypothetical protein